MKLHPRFFVATPFLGFSAYLFVALLLKAPALFTKDWFSILSDLLLSSVLLFVIIVPGILALNRRWAEFTQIIGFFAALAIFAFLSRHTSDLARTTDDLIRADYPLLGAAWGLCVAISPFVVSIVAYKRLVPLIIRRIYRARISVPLNTSHF